MSGASGRDMFSGIFDYAKACSDVSLACSPHRFLLQASGLLSNILLSKERFLYSAKRRRGATPFMSATMAEE